MVIVEPRMANRTRRDFPCVSIWTQLGMSHNQCKQHSSEYRETLLWLPPHASVTTKIYLSDLMTILPFTGSRAEITIQMRVNSPSSTCWLSFPPFSFLHLREGEVIFQILRKFHCSVMWGNLGKRMFSQSEVWKSFHATPGGEIVPYCNNFLSGKRFWFYGSRIYTNNLANNPNIQINHDVCKCWWWTTS